MEMDIRSEITNHKRGSKLRKTTVALVAGSLLVALSGCAFFDNEARDKRACDRLSDVLTSEGNGSLPADASSDLIGVLEREVLPLASGELGGQIKDLIDSYDGLASKSVFDQIAGGVDTLYYAGVVLDRCIELSSRSFGNS